jgi:ABC-type sugar transport system permease subunit
MKPNNQVINQEVTSSSRSLTVSGLVFRLVILAVIDAFASWFFLRLIAEDNPILAIAVALVTIFVNVIILRRDTFPIRWMLLGLVLMAMFAIYPILYNIYVAFTNYGFGHLLTKEQAIQQIESINYLPEEGGTYTWTAFISEDGEFAIWLNTDAGQSYLAIPDQEIILFEPGLKGVGDLDGDGIPLEIEGYDRLNRLSVVRYIDTLGELSFLNNDGQNIQITSLDAAAEEQPKYAYDPAADTITDNVIGDVYSPLNGIFTSNRGEELKPGFQIFVGVDNFIQFFESPALSGPLVRIIVWNFAFAFLSVAMTFALGLMVAIVFSDQALPGRKLISTLLLIPYTIPSLITIMVWRGLLNPQLGIVNRMFESFINWSPPWFTDPLWAKAAILLVNLWLGYPYFMLICSGALQAIPEDIYGAAEVDGANVFQRFWRITLPLLLVAVGPLLVASFVFNFNNFNIIFLFIQGGPPIAGAVTQAGHTDILISYVYNLAFSGGRGAQYGLASAITIVIFFIVAVITLFQFRYTRMWEEVSENV